MVPGSDVTRKKPCFPHSGASAAVLGDTRDANLGSVWSLRGHPRGSPPQAPAKFRGKCVPPVPLWTAALTHGDREGISCKESPAVSCTLAPA